MDGVISSNCKGCWWIYKSKVSS